MNKPPEPCQKPFTPCWCETRPNNPHCDVTSVPIDNVWFAIALTTAILIYLLKTKKQRDIMKTKTKECKHSNTEKLLGYGGYHYGNKCNDCGKEILHKGIVTVNKEP